MQATANDPPELVVGMFIINFVLLIRDIKLEIGFLLIKQGPKVKVVTTNLRTVPTIVIAHTFCASRDTLTSYRQCLLNYTGIFLHGFKLSGESRS